MVSSSSAVEPRYNEGTRGLQNLFVITRFRYMEVHFHIFYYWGKENRSLHRGLRYIGVRYVEDFVIQGFVMSRTSLYRGSLYRGLRYTGVRYIEVLPYKV